MDSEVNIGNIGDILYSLGNITLLTMLTYWFERLMIFEMAEVETPSLLATSPLEFLPCKKSDANGYACRSVLRFACWILFLQWVRMLLTPLICGFFFQAI